MDKDEKIEAFVTARNFEQPSYVTMITQKGTIKKTNLIAFSHPRANGIIAIKLDEDDKLIDAQLIEEGNNVIIATSNGFANRFIESDVRSTGRNTHGVRAISLREGDRVVAMVVIKRRGTILAISENGYGKRTNEELYRKTRRGSKGVITLKTSKRNGHLISLMEVVDNDDLMIVTKKGMIIRQPVEKITIVSRNTQGVRLINLNGNDKVFDITRIAAEDIIIEDDDEKADVKTESIENTENVIKEETEE